MFCPKCGTYNENGSYSCVKCGYGFGNIPDSIKGAERPAQTGAEEAADSAAAHSSENTVFGGSAANGTNVYGDFHGGGTYASTNTARKKSSKFPKDYFVQSVLTAILCSVTFGVAAIIFSGMTQTERSAGNIAKAELYSEKTKMFCWIAFAVGVAKYLFAIGFVAFAAAGLLRRGGVIYPFYY